MSEKLSRRRVLAAAGSAAAAGLAGCSGVSGSPPGGGGGGGGGSSRGDNTCPDGAVATREKGDATGRPVTADATLHVPHDLEKLADASRSGGPPKDGIPAIEEPCFVPAGDVGDWLADGDIVFGAVLGGDVRAYPRKILSQHEIVNDVLGGENVSVTYCPLTGTAMGFFRGETTFGVSGNLVNNNLVMYDRATDSRWPQVTGTAMKGEFKGQSLPEFRVVWTTWGQWRSVHPESRVMSRSTGYARNYKSDPYGTYNPKGGYYSSDSTLFPRLVEDDRFPLKEVFIGARTTDGAALFHKAALADAGTMAGEIAGTPVVAVYDAALDTAYVYRNPGEASFEGDGTTVRGPDGSYDPDSLPLDRVYAFDGMWFAFIGFYPDANVYS
ncbi:MAG: DUF3179 domain-containing protein [Halobacteriaceae archaeon]